MPSESFSREEKQSALFAQLVMQYSNLTMVMLGKMPNPQSGKIELDLEAAQFFIDQLEMLEAKTKGNLTATESTMLKQVLMGVRMNFVETVDAPPPKVPQAKSTPDNSPSPTEPEAKPSPTTEEAGDKSEESKKRFTKKFDL